MLSESIRMVLFTKRGDSIGGEKIKGTEIINPGEKRGVEK